LLCLICFVGAGVWAAPATATTITVNSNGDSESNNGFCTLREAVRAANEDFWAFGAAGECAAGSGADTIVFVASFDGDTDATNKITLAANTPLDPISEPVTINGGNCGNGTNPKPCVHLDANGGANLDGETGFDVQSDDVTIRGIAITDADSINTAAIVDNGSARLHVQNVWFGLKLDGTPESNTTGVAITGTDAVIGGTTAADRNLFVRTEFAGVSIFGAENTKVQGNYFGTLADGVTTTGLDNFVDVQVLGDSLFGDATGTLIGGPEQGAVGTCDAPCNLFASQTASINLKSSSSLTLDAGETRIEGNFLGLSPTGAALPGVTGGIQIGAADDVTVGGDASRRNYVKDDIQAGQGATNLLIDSNFVGLNSAGTARVADGLIQLGDLNKPVDGARVTNNRIATTPGGFTGILTTANNSRIQGNTIGIGTAGQNVGGGSSGVSVSAGTNNVVADNVIGNANVGILVGGANGLITGNLIGTDSTQTQPHPIAQTGVLVNSLGGNQIGGNTAASENVIVNLTAGDAIRVISNGNDFNRILRNRGTASLTGAFIDLAGLDGQGNGASGPNEGIERPVVTVGATSKQVSGTGALPGATVRVYRTASVAGVTGPRDVTAYAGQTVADGSGNWTLNCPSAGCEVGLPAAGQVTVNQTSTTGNSSEMADSRAYADLEPETTIPSGPANGGATNDATPTFVFASSEPSSTFQCKVDAGAFGACTGPGLTHTTGALSEGAHTFSVQAIDSTGHPDPSPASVTFTIDLTPPDTHIDSGPADGAGTSDTTPTFAFSATEPGSSFECRFDGSTFSACSGPGAEHTPAALGEGQHTFEVRAVDTAGNADGSGASRAFSVDATGPETSIDSGPAAGSITSDTTPTFAFSSSETGSTFECRIDGGAFGGCTATHTVAALGNGTHTLEVRATDPVGNTDASPASRTFTVDSSPPETRIDEAPKGNLRVGKPAVYEFSSDEAGSTFRCSIDGGAQASCSSPLTIRKPKKGKHSLEVVAVDAAGNVDPSPATDTFKVKKRKPRRTK
jgi:CSLREA domain-containing protein